MKTEELQEQYIEETGKRWWTNPVCHGEIGFASWEYQKWLETKLTEATARSNVEAEVIKKNGGRDPFLILHVFLYSDFNWREIVIDKEKSKELKEPIHISLKDLENKLNEKIPDANIVIKSDWYSDND